MRQEFSVTVEAGRVRDGDYRTNAGHRYGAFFLRCPVTGQKLKILASSGEDWNECGLDGEPWEHVSVSTPNRCPTWEEMAWVKQLFFEDSEAVMEFHVPAKSHINFHPYCLHLWRPTKTPVLLPPEICVGPKEVDR